MKTQVLLSVQILLAMALMWSCFCRLLKTDMDTHREVRWAILFEGIAAGVVGGAPILPLLMAEAKWTPWTTPYWAWLALLIAVTLVQIVTAKYWSAGRAPAHFQKAPRWPAGAIFGLMLIIVGLFASPSTANAQGEYAPLVQFEQGQMVICPFEGGCFAMSADFLEKLSAAADSKCPSAPAPKPGKFST